jgi:hypothetical protein
LQKNLKPYSLFLIGAKIGFLKQIFTFAYLFCG